MSSLIAEISDELVRHPRGWVFFDAECSFCCRLIRTLEPALLRRRLRCAPLQEHWVAEMLGLPRAELLSEMRFWLEDGRTLSGADAVLELSRYIWWARPLYLLARIPLLRAAIRYGYRRMAARRHCISECLARAGVRRKAA